MGPMVSEEIMSPVAVDRGAVGGCGACAALPSAHEEHVMLVVCFRTAGVSAGNVRAMAICRSVSIGAWFRAKCHARGMADKPDGAWVCGIAALILFVVVRLSVVCLCWFCCGFGLGFGREIFGVIIAAFWGVCGFLGFWFLSCWFWGMFCALLGVCRGCGCVIRE